MGPDVMSGLSAHVLLVHIVVVFVPLAAVLVILSAVWPAARRRLGIITPIVALLAVASIPPTTNAGEWLIKRVQGNPLVHEHAELADGLLSWAIGMLAFAVVIWVLWAKQNWFVRTSGATRPSSAPAPEREKELALVGAPAPAMATRTAVPERTTTVRVRTIPTWLRIVRVVAVVLALVVSSGSVVDVYRIGDSGARAVWQTSFSMVPTVPK